ncbi:hypothetical protein Tcan_06877 [Toxocara canis]|uniref:F-box domain-containing protein n=1 Tax=Toxocara canis TaxID=6265 RepID=A0A0B2V797_TOXCA|nr:hypothetical protein Tcan_06877 [Toxocara canis]
MSVRRIRLSAAQPMSCSKADEHELILLSTSLVGGSNATYFDRIQKLVLRCGFASINARLKQPICYLNTLPDNVLLQIVSMVPVRERIANVSILERRLRRLSRLSITSVSFYRDELDALSDERLQSFVNQYGAQLLYANFDLYRSCLGPSQWKWRTSIKSVVSMCWRLRSLDILFCDHHKLRDADLIDVFKSCPHLLSLRIDAQFIRGHSFQYAPRGMQQLEMEMCCRIDRVTFRHITGRLHKLKHGLFRLARMPKLCCLNLDGITKRDIGLGVERIAAGQRLVKLFLAEGTNISPDSLVRIVHSSPLLRTLDISSNEGIYNYSFARELVKFWVAKFGAHLRLEGKDRACYRPLYILTDEHLPWNIVERPEPDEYGRTIVTVVHLRREFIPELVILFLRVTVKFWVAKFGAHLRLEGKDRACYRPLYILTDEHLPWNIVERPEPDEYGRTIVTVVHLRREFIPEEEILPTTVLSDESPLRLPSGVMAPQIRRGNRYRLMWSALGPSSEPRLSISPTLQLDLSAFVLPQPDDSFLTVGPQRTTSHGAFGEASVTATRNDESAFAHEPYMQRALAPLSTSPSSLIPMNAFASENPTCTQQGYGQHTFGLPSFDPLMQIWPTMVTFAQPQTDKENRPWESGTDESPLRLPSGVMAPQIRRGNRYRLMWSALGPSSEPRLSISPTLQLDLSAFVLPQPDDSFLTVGPQRTTSHGAFGEASVTATRNDESAFAHEPYMQRALAPLSTSPSSLIPMNAFASENPTCTQQGYGQHTFGLPSFDPLMQIWPTMVTFAQPQTDKENRPWESGTVVETPSMSLQRDVYSSDVSSQPYLYHNDIWTALSVDTELDLGAQCSFLETRHRCELNSLSANNSGI